MKKKKSEPLYDRYPSTPKWEDLVIKLTRASGWKKRNQIEQMCDEAQMNFSSALSHFKEKDYMNMLVCIEDGIAAVELLKNDLVDE